MPSSAKAPPGPSKIGCATFALSMNIDPSAAVEMRELTRASKTVREILRSSGALSKRFVGSRVGRTVPRYRDRSLRGIWQAAVAIAEEYAMVLRNTGTPSSRKRLNVSVSRSAATKKVARLTNISL